jgi:hypothetical protein
MDAVGLGGKKTKTTAAECVGESVKSFKKHDEKDKKKNKDATQMESCKKPQETEKGNQDTVTTEMEMVTAGGDVILATAVRHVPDVILSDKTRIRFVKK